VSERRPVDPARQHGPPCSTPAAGASRKPGQKTAARCHLYYVPAKTRHAPLIDRAAIRLRSPRRANSL
jgi:hypothetical protein